MSRLFKITHLVMMLVSVVGVADASRIERAAHWSIVYLPASAGQTERERDRRYTDLAREDRKRRESAQRATGRRTAAAGLQAPRT